MTYNEMVDHYFFQLAEEEHIDRDALTAEQQLALAEAEQQYDARLDNWNREPFGCATTASVHNSSTLSFKW